MELSVFTLSSPSSTATGTLNGLSNIASKINGWRHCGPCPIKMIDNAVNCPKRRYRFATFHKHFAFTCRVGTGYSCLAGIRCNFLAAA